MTHLSAQYIRTLPKLGYRFVAPVHNLCTLSGEPQRGDHQTSQRPIRILVFPFRRGLGIFDVEHLAYSLPEAISTTLAEMNMFTVRSVQLGMRFDPVHWDPKRWAKRPT